MRRTLVTVMLVVAALGAGASPAQAQRARGDVDLFARIPAPGFPALGYVHPNGRVYEGTYVNPNGTPARSRVFEYTGAGTLLRSWTVPGQNLSEDHGVQVTTSAGDGDLVVLDRSPPRALRLDRGTGEFSSYSTFADLKPCPAGQARRDCSPTGADNPAVPNFGAWGPDGSLYVTDYLQGVVWRVPPRGGPASVWLSDRRLDGGDFGTTGIMLEAGRQTLLVAQGSSAGGADGNPATGKIYRVPIRPDGTAGPMARVWESRPGDLPDGFAIARSGRLYVPLAGLANQVAVVSPGGAEIERFGQANSGDNGSPVPFDTPSSARFLGTRIVIANQSAIQGDPTHHALLDLETGEAGLPEFIPGDRTAPVLSRVSLSRKRFRVARRGRAAARRVRRGTRIRFRLSEPARVYFGVDRRVRRRWRRVRTFKSLRRAGRSSVAFSGRVKVRRRKRALRPGRYRMVLRARDSAGNRSKRVARRFRIVR